MRPQLDPLPELNQFCPTCNCELGSVAYHSGGLRFCNEEHADAFHRGMLARQQFTPLLRGWEEPETPTVSIFDTTWIPKIHPTHP